MRIERRYTKEGQSPYADIVFRLTTSEIRNPDGSVVFHAENVEVPEQWSQVASDVLAQKYFRKAGVPSRLKKVEEETVPSWLWRSVRRRSGARRTCPKPSASPAKSPASRCSTGWPAPGPIGAGRAAISPAKPTRRRSSTSTATCWRCRWWRRIRRNGSTPACTGPMASTARARAISTSTTGPASWCSRPPPTSIRSRMPASSSQSPTTSSTRAASWICGCGKRACSNTAPAPARISQSCAAKAKGCRAAASRPA